MLRYDLAWRAARGGLSVCRDSLVVTAPRSPVVTWNIAIHKIKAGLRSRTRRYSRRLVTILASPICSSSPSFLPTCIAPRPATAFPTAAPPRRFSISSSDRADLCNDLQPLKHRQTAAIANATLTFSRISGPSERMPLFLSPDPASRASIFIPRTLFSFLLAIVLSPIHFFPSLRSQFSAR